MLALVKHDWQRRVQADVSGTEGVEKTKGEDKKTIGEVRVIKEWAAQQDQYCRFEVGHKCKNDGVTASVF